jgi:hypothetical protein
MDTDPIQSKLVRAWNLFDAYVKKPLSGERSTASFWYLPDTPNIRDRETHAAYLAMSPSPFYPIDYRTRISYQVGRHPAGILSLPYPQPIGDQVNPEAAFQYALGWHDVFVRDCRADAKKPFLHHAAYFRNKQNAQGDFSYEFDWFESRAPWHSGLAQSRGASVMLRAFLLSGDKAYATAARRAISRFSIPCEQGGYRAIFPLTGTPYFEEYPNQKNAVINGFMASLFGLYEVGTFLDDADPRALFEEGVVSLERMLPHYTLDWWTLYDRFGPDSGSNIHSPRYQIMVINYLTALAAITDNPRIAEYRDRWRGFDTSRNRTRAYVLKAKRKILHR